MQPNHLHFDCYSGISGDMTLGALVDLGVPVAELQAGLAGLAIGPFALRAERVKRQGIMGTKVHVEVDEEDREGGHGHGHGHHGDHGHGQHGHGHGHESHGHEHGHSHHGHGQEHGHEHEVQHEHPHREGEAAGKMPALLKHEHAKLNDILEILEGAALPARAAARAARAYRKLAEAEATVHGSTPEAIHFHEVGAKDAIVDVAGAMLGLELLGIDSFSASAVTVGFGTVRCHHGMMPIPAPATAELLKGVAQTPGVLQAEMVTPTGAAILSALLEENGRPADAGRIVERWGYGAGSRIFEGHANFLRLALCCAEAPAALPVREHTVAILETEIDDMSPEVAGYLMERLLEDGAYDVQFQAVQMKKNRPALRLRVLCEPDAEARLAERIFRETSTFGIRHQLAARWCLGRRMETVETPAGPVAVKLGLWGEQVLKASPEYEDCRRLARERGVALAEVYELAREAIRKRWQM